tara:strand:- start:164 stop:574 length:411 start_codon:yes stop_codon:yes gene_type:complete
MELNVRTLNGDDYKELCSWWEKWNWPILSRDMLPGNGTSGIMISKNNTNIVAGFLYWSNSNLVWLDWIISNPEYKENDRKKAIEMLISTSEDMVAESGKKYMMSISRSKSLLETHKKLGWSVDGTASHEMVKIINK